MLGGGGGGTGCSRLRNGDSFHHARRLCLRAGARAAVAGVLPLQCHRRVGDAGGGGAGAGLALEVQAVLLQVAGHILPRHAIDVHHLQDHLGDGIVHSLQAKKTD